jgi:RNA polymerase sigma-70 factor (ECF subfamily)
MHHDEGLDFEKLVPQNYKKVYGTLLRLTENSDDARDLTQETFVKAFIMRGAFRGDSNPGTWFVAIALNLATDFFRKKKRIAATEIDEDQAGSYEANQDVSLTVESIMGRLPPLDRLILAKRYLQDMPQESIAQDLGISVGAVKMRLARAKDRFAQLYGTKK